jgi:hypothetical protein
MSESIHVAPEPVLEAQADHDDNSDSTSEQVKQEQKRHEDSEQEYPE